MEQLKTPEEILAFKLGKALTMEAGDLDMLGEFVENAQRQELKDFFTEHQEQTRAQADRLRKVFELLGLNAKEETAPALTGLAKEGRTAMTNTAEELVDSVILASALAAEYYEVAAYESLITMVQAQGETEVAALLQESLDEERQTIARAQKLAEAVAKESAGVAAK
ncbi:hypothetical protein BN1051_02837 [Arthrobacter saudimassiliensis]|uniref:Uncharacterized protein n=1 Tax=Arthrobacter saudimassiliensis TaxID=1461584 RepID=A0A078MVK7_9MICC|nr:hypothetical protein BN1051_02837 [Arthrobacter saudimassiliensis]